MNPEEKSDPLCVPSQCEKKLENVCMIRSVSSFVATLGKLTILVLVGLLSVGCRDKAKAPRQTTRSIDALQKKENEQNVFEHAWSTLNHLEQFDAPETLFIQAVDRLDHWVKDQEPLTNWRRDPMLDSLSEDYLKLPIVENLDSLEFSLDAPNYDGVAFRELIWIRDVSTWARGKKIEGISRATHLFDWTIRNIQLERPTKSGTLSRIHQKPWETLVSGRGTATDRTWVFILLARQQGLDAAVLGVKIPNDPNDPKQEKIWSWLIAVREDKELYLFDPTLGIPIPGPDGIRLGDDGQLEITPATLTQVVEDESLLKRLKLDNERPYPITSKQASNVTVFLEASPSYLSQRMKLIENRLSGANQCVLTSNPTAEAKRFEPCNHVADVQLWEVPQETLLQEHTLGIEQRNAQFRQAMSTFQVPTLHKGRIYHLKGQFTDSPSALDFYQSSRMPNSERRQAKIDTDLKELMLLAKLDASYWLGLIAFEQGNASSAIDYFKVRTLKLLPKGPWTTGATYNLGRAYELDGKPLKAIEVYLADQRSPAFHGNLLRARWLGSLSKSTQPKPSTNKPPPILPTPPTLPVPDDLETPTDTRF